MNYSELIKKSWQATWKYKNLWWLGMMIMAGGSGGGGNVQLPIDGGNFDGSNTDMTPIQHSLAELWWVFVIIGILLLLLMLIMIFLHHVATAGLYYGANDVRLNKQPTFKASFKHGIKKFWPVFGLKILSGLALGAMILMIAVPLVLLGLTIVGLIIVVPVAIVLIIAAIPFFAAYAIVIVYATQYIVLHDEPMVEAFKKGWYLLKDNIQDSVVPWLINILIGIGFVIVAIGVVLVVALPLVLIGFVTYNAAGWGPIVALAIVGFIILFALLTVLKGIHQTFVFHIWHNVFAYIKAKPAKQLTTGNK